MTNTSPSSAIELYIQGVATGNAEALNAAFHPDARMFGALGDQRVDIPIQDMIGMISAQPADVDGQFSASIKKIDEFGDIATAIVEEENFWGSVSFTDVFSLAKIDNNWLIVNKAFTHTGGTPPAH
ncbi:MAG: nuclear transport factor 2 family protein [Planctomycetota bacterium]|mgnify:FL=1|nr:nuclear transport factor 2 family protein [Planctomycetota bacterium]